AGYGAGCDLLRLGPAGPGSLRVEPCYTARSPRPVNNVMGGGGGVGRHPFGHSDGKGWVWQGLGAGELRWQERSRLRGKGALVFADQRLYLCGETGTVVLLEASRAAGREHGRFDLPQTSRLRTARPTCALAQVWTPPVVANGRLYLRDQEYLFCFDVQDGGTAARGSGPTAPDRGR